MNVVDLSDLWSAIRVVGSDARQFLHSQLTTDVNELTGDAAALSAYLSPKGRVLGLLLLVPRDDGVLVLTHPSLVDALTRRLRMFVLRAKVTIEPVAEPVVGGLRGVEETAPLGEPLALETLPGGATSIAWPGERRLVLGAEPSSAPAESNAWLADDIRLGIPIVTEGTSDRHVAQMLELGRLGALSLRKGCYPGQEIVARAHYLGKVKRRLARFRLSRPLAPGTPLTLEASTVGEILMSAQAPESDAEALAVVAEGALNALLRDPDGEPCEPLGAFGSEPEEASDPMQPP